MMSHSCRRSVQRLVLGSWNESFHWQEVSNFDFNITSAISSWICGAGTSTTLSTTVRFCTRFMMRISDSFLRHLNHDVDDLSNDDALLNSLLRCVPHSSLPGEHRSFRHSLLWNHLDVLASGKSISSIIFPNLHLLIVLLQRDLVSVLLLRDLDSLLHQLVGVGNLLRYHVCRTALCFVLSGACVIETVLRPLGCVGHPRPPRLPGSIVPWCPCWDPLGCPPTLCGCAYNGDGRHVLWTSCLHAFF